MGSVDMYGEGPETSASLLGTGEPYNLMFAAQRLALPRNSLTYGKCKFLATFAKPSSSRTYRCV